MTEPDPMYRFTRTDVDLEAIRKRIAAMPDDVLLRYGKSAAFMAGRSSRETWRVQLEEARAEWKRREERKASAPAADRNEGASGPPPTSN